MKSVNFEGHALYPAPSAVDIVAMAERWGCDAFTAAERFRRARAEMIEREADDAFNFPYVPSVWTVAWALLDWPYWPKSLAKKACERWGCDLWGVMRMMREELGFEGPVSYLWISGANGAGKSEIMAYMVNAQMAAKDKQDMFVMSTTEKDSVEAEIHKKLYKYIPKPWVKSGKTENAYISYKAQNGFANSRYMFPNGSSMSMKFYGQDPEGAGEGFNADAIFPDESIPIDWYSRLPARVGRRNGFVVLTNTPQTGYTDVVRDFMDGMVVTRWACGYMLPKDGGEPLQARALGLTDEQFEELNDAHAQRPERAPRVPECVSEDCWSWVRGAEAGCQDGGPKLQGWWNARRPIDKAPSVQVGSRLFEAVPRVGKCKDSRKAVVFFHSSDNPFGNPRNLIADMAGLDGERIRCRLYGLVTPSRSAVFAKFSRSVHVLPVASMPTGGTRYWINDPAPGRNAFILWGVVRGDTRYIYREFPGGYFLPDIGHPGPWAKASSKKDGINDGERAEATSSFGWGVARYKAMTAWLEGWSDFERWAKGKGGGTEHAGAEAGCQDGGGTLLAWPRTVEGDFIWPTVEEVKLWEDSADVGMSREPIERRVMDPRGGAAAHLAMEGVSTLIGDYNDMGMRVEPAFSGTVLSGIDAITGALDAPGGGRPKLFISEACTNLIWALEHWKALDGETSATKDPIDCLRYFFTSDCVDVTPVAGSGRRRQTFHESERAAAGIAEALPEARAVVQHGGRRMRVRVC